MMKAKWQELVTHNPMLIEIQRFRRRFFSFGGSNAINGVILGLAIVCYAGLLMLTFSSRGAIPPIGIVLFQTFIFLLIAPSMMYGAVAGERERRTWDLLIAAPITKAQIASGKFLGGLTATGIGYGLLSFPILICAFEYENTNWYYLLLAELISITFTVFVLALTLFFSARVRRSFMALGAVLGFLAITLLVVPMIFSAVVMDSFTNAFINFFNPFYAESMLLTASESIGYPNPVPIETWGWPQILSYLILSALVLTWTAKTLTFAENDVRFIGRKSHA